VGEGGRGGERAGREEGRGLPSDGERADNVALSDPVAPKRGDQGPEGWEESAWREGRGKREKEGWGRGGEGGREGGREGTR
jgi:hypothetical protein